jgi:hypothetical protein
MDQRLRLFGAFQGRVREGDRVVNKERLDRYSLAGPENQAAVEVGLAGADWFRSGKALGAPVLEDVRTYPAKVVDGTVFIQIG